MRLIDTQASRVLQKFEIGELSLNAEQRSDWIRFLLSLHFRTPAAVSVIKEQMALVWRTILDEARATYQTNRGAEEPSTFDEFLATIDERADQREALRMLAHIIDNENIGPIVNAMRWHVVSLEGSRFSLLTSDRPLDRPFGLGDPEAFIALPIGPKRLFFAARNGISSKYLDGAIQRT